MICSPAELRKRVGAFISSGVNRFVCAVGLDLPEEQEVPLAGNRTNERFVRGRLNGRIRDIDCIEGEGAVRANLI